MVKRRQRPDGECYRYNHAESNDLMSLETWFRGYAGLRPTQTTDAVRTCEEALVYTLSDLRNVHARGQLACLFSNHGGICSRVEAQLGRTAPGRAGGGGHHGCSCSDTDGTDGGTMDMDDEEVSIHVRYNDHATVKCDVTPRTTVRQIKEFLAGISRTSDVLGYGCPVEAQQLVHCGRVLSDDSKAVLSYGIEPYSCLWLIPRKTSTSSW